jgi:hypothetical protein
MEPDDGSNIVTLSVKAQLKDSNDSGHGFASYTNATNSTGRGLLKFVVSGTPSVDWNVLKVGSRVTFDCRELTDHSVEITNLALAPAR